MRADISSHVHGRVHGRMSTATADETLNRLGQLYGFDWYCDGQTIYVSGYGEAARKVLPLGQVLGDELLHAIDALGVSDQRWPVRMSPAGDIAFVNGPPHYVALVEETLSALSERVHSSATEVHVFRGGTS
jgi:type III secretion protein C